MDCFLVGISKFDASTSFIMLLSGDIKCSSKPIKGLQRRWKSLFERSEDWSLHNYAVSDTDTVTELQKKIIKKGGYTSIAKATDKRKTRDWIKYMFTAFFKLAMLRI